MSTISPKAVEAAMIRNRRDAKRCRQLADQFPELRRFQDTAERLESMVEAAEHWLENYADRKPFKVAA